MNILSKPLYEEKMIYKCKTCNKTYTTNASLKRHYNTISHISRDNQYKFCKVCETWLYNNDKGCPTCELYHRPKLIMR